MTASREWSISLDELRLATRGLGSDEWRERYHEGVEEAHRAKDPSRVAAMAIVAAAHLESEGLLAEALAEVGISLASLSEEPLEPAVVELTGLHATLQALLGDVDQARETARRLSAEASDASDRRTRATAETFAAVVGCIALDPLPVPELRSLVADADRLDLIWLSSGLRAWATPYIAATGDFAEATAWASALEMQATAQGHAWREDDAMALCAALRMARGEFGRVPAWKSRNPHARRRLAVSRVAFNCGFQPQRFADALPQVEEADPGQDDVLEPYRPLIEVRTNSAEASVDATPPPALTLFTLPEALANAEAVAIAGSQTAAVSWLRWFDDRLPEGVVTCLEWPVSVQRMRGLLAARAGALDAGIRFLREAVEQAGAMRADAEVAISEVQLAELLGAAPTQVRRREWDVTRRMGQRHAQAIGLPVDTHPSLATAGLTLARFDGAKSGLTRREIEVLSVIGEGGTYKSVALKLGVSWQTVQKHCSNAYQKLGAEGRVEALKRARELGLL